jgi:hypothetical protein
MFGNVKLLPLSKINPFFLKRFPKKTAYLIEEGCEALRKPGKIEPGPGWL